MDGERAPHPRRPAAGASVRPLASGGARARMSANQATSGSLSARQAAVTSPLPAVCLGARRAVGGTRGARGCGAAPPRLPTPWPPEAMPVHRLAHPSAPRRTAQLPPGPGPRWPGPGSPRRSAWHQPPVACRAIHNHRGVEHFASQAGDLDLLRSGAGGGADKAGRRRSARRGSARAWRGRLRWRPLAGY